MFANTKAKIAAAAVLLARLIVPAPLPAMGLFLGTLVVLTTMPIGHKQAASPIS